jgi:hypothetical protein
MPLAFFDGSHHDWWCYRCEDTRGVAVCPVCGLKAPVGYDIPPQDSHNDSSERTVGELERANATLKHIQSTLASRPRDVWSLFWFIVIIFLLESWPGSGWDRWTDKAWYSVRYDAAFADITVEYRPVDCDFMHAPLGDKGCSYKKHVAGRQGTTNIVIVDWEKKED